jgi:predicted MFS family arabinose efflux permease
MLKRGPGGLLREHDFRHLWAADAISQVGTRMSLLAVPLLALTVLDATPFEVALLSVCERGSSLLLGLVVGAWADRLRCRPLLIGADLGRAVLLGSIPAAAVFDVLTLGQLYVVLFLVGAHTVVFDVAHQTYLPRLVAAGDLVEGNAKLAANHSVGAVAGAGAGGYLVQWLTAPYVVLLDALSYLWSALWLRGIRKPEPKPQRTEPTPLGREVRDGLRYVARQPILRAVTLNSATIMFFQAAQGAVILVFLVRELGLSPGLIGLLSMIGLVAAILSSMVTTWIGARIGTARAMLLGSAVTGAGYLLFPLTTAGAGLAFYVAAGALTAFGIILLRILEATAIQQVCVPGLRGRVAATVGVATGTVLPVGALLGGVLAGTLGLRGTLWLTGVMMCSASLWLICSPLRWLRDIPAEQ